MKKKDLTCNETLLNLYCDKHRSMIAFCYSICSDIEMSKDIVQNLFLKMFQKKDLSKIQNMDFYVFKALKINTFNELKKKGRRKQVLETLIENAKQNKTFFTRGETNHDFILEEYLNKQIHRLPIKRRRTFIMKRLQGKTINQWGSNFKTHRKRSHIRSLWHDWFFWVCWSHFFWRWTCLYHRKIWLGMDVCKLYYLNFVLFAIDDANMEKRNELEDH